MRIGKWLVVVFLLFFSATAEAQDKTYMAVCSMPFQGFFQDNGFHNQIVGDSNFAWEIRRDFIMELPKAFPKKGAVKGINADGHKVQLTVRKVDTGALLENDYILEPPIVYTEDKCADLVWTGSADIQLAETIKTKVPDDAFAEIKKNLPNKAVINFSDLEGFAIKGLGDRLFIHTKEHFFIYSLKANKILYKPFYQNSVKPELYFRVNGTADLYVLVDVDDNYEYSWHSIIDAKSGETMLSTF